MYLLDANVFIQAKNFHYRFATFPCFWTWLDAENTKGNVASTEFIQNELTCGTDHLCTWAQQAMPSWFLKENDTQTQTLFIQIANWINTQNFKPQAKQEFLSGGDPWVIAKAVSINATVVTHEKSDPNSKRKIFIPDICKQFGAPYIDTFDMLETLRAKF